MDRSSGGGTAKSFGHGKTLLTEHGQGRIPHGGGGLMLVDPVKSTATADKSFGSGLFEAVVQLTTPITARRAPHAKAKTATRIFCLIVGW